MYVRRLEIENIRSFRNLDIEFSKGINIIAGANNSGKSTVLKALYLLQEGLAFRDQDLRINTRSSAVKMILQNISEKDAILFKNPEKGAQFLPSLPIAHVFFPRSTPISDYAFYETSNSIDTPALKDVNVEMKSRKHTSLRFPSFPTYENKGNFIYPFFAKRRSGFLTTTISQDNTYHVYDDYRNLAAKVQKASNLRITKDRFKELCNDILGFEVSTYNGENGENRIGVHVGYNNLIPLESMGEGTANILGLITLLLTENNKLFLLEELENDVHPEALKKLLPLIIDKSTENQFVISTHSNIILKYLGGNDAAKIFFISWGFADGEKGNDLPTSNISEVSNSTEERITILEQLGYEHHDYELCKGYIIFEESSAEKIIQEFIIPEYVPALKGKIKTVASQGINDVETKFHSLNSLFMYLHRNEIYRNKAWVIVDGDDPGKSVINQLKNKYPAWSESHFQYFECPYFERYYPRCFKDEVESVMKLNRGQQKQKAKAKLLQDVLDWIKKNPDEARVEFQETACDVIEKLKTISTSLG